ncbi:glutathione S-transferase 1-like [Spodoptera litura]|uniref:Glutathione S-transferase 1-like n=1 Tax=Spodoptera litura TaxID=69820 RepID=A0A9J7IKH5_SPOLT|nr:glutathione S-transferase 1-like [Spodoptera litura]
MVIKLYTTELSPSVRASIMAFEIFQVPYENIEVNLSDKSMLDPEFLNKNPMRTVPVLEDEDFILHDGHAILMYLADAYGTEDSWYPKDYKTRALVNQKLSFINEIIFSGFKKIAYSVVVERRKTLMPQWIETIEEGYSIMEKFLSKTTYIATDDVTIADLSAYSNMSCLMYVIPVDRQKYPKTLKWCHVMEMQPYCKEFNNKSAATFGDLYKLIMSH